MHVDELETPSVLIDLDRMERNIARMQDYCDQHGLAFRPHIKTHKCPEIARLQIEAGAVGIACQKISEAEVFAGAGFNDLQIPYNIVGAAKTARLVDLAMYNRVTVSADHLTVIAGLADAAGAEDLTLRVMVELATEIERAGAPVDEVVTLAQRIDAEPNLHFAGLLLYPSNPAIRPLLQEALDRLNHAGIGVDVVSGGGTGAAFHAHEIPELTEIRVGTYIFNDWATVSKGWAALDDCAMAVLATVVSRPTPDRAILDAGSKTLALDSVDGLHGFILEYPNARIYKLNEEHAYVDLSACDDRPVIGDRLHIIPAHTCVVSNLHNRLYGVRDEQIEVVWPVAARGRVW
ncbi:MAG: D-TA family PLP-dependent enzyme [Chloroflexi bacterium]|nr:D-TA family PLP-dependent enzyme [Chloroflexota bacterium]MDL1883117.1 D-TA family PLP-dependent enzyme [Anaerolineae bacterium CFX8]